jgi:hypothetical protein
MKYFLLFACLYSALTYASTPIVQYSWHNQMAASQVFIFDDGEILHQERLQYSMETIDESPLTESELHYVKKLVKDAAESAVSSENILSTMGSYSGGIEIKTQSGMKIIEGVVRDGVNLKQAKAYRSFSPATEKLKDFIFKYSEKDMSF